MNILFVCTGNTCRSPMAQAILQQKRPDWDVRSAGLYAEPGTSASFHTIRVLEQNGIRLEHESTQATEPLLEWADHILVMTASHKQLIDIHFPQFAEKTVRLKGDEGDVSDPFGGTQSDYERAFQEIEQFIDKWLWQQ